MLTPQIKYKEISSDAELKATSSYLGISSIIASIASGGLFVLCVWGAKAVAGSNSAGDTLTWVYVAMLVVCAVFLLAEYVFGGVMSAVYQIKCNRRPISWIALFVLVATTAAITVGTVFILS